jgi:hypothetical protein
MGAVHGKSFPTTIELSWQLQCNAAGAYQQRYEVEKKPLCQRQVWLAARMLSCRGEISQQAGGAG